MSSAAHVKDYVDNVLHSESSSSTINARNRVIAATAGTIIAETLIAPTNIIKERQIQYMSNQLTSGKFSQMPSIAQTTRDIMSEHGYMGLFQGYYSSLFKQIGYKSLVLLSYEPIRNQLWNWRAKYFASSKKSETSQFLHDMKDKIEHGKIEPSKVFHDIKEKIEDKTINPSEIMNEVKDKLHLKKRQLSAYVYDEYSRSVLICLLSGGLAGMIGYTLMNPMEAFSSPKFIQSTQLPTGATLNDRMEQTKYSGKSRFWLKPNLMYVFLIYATEFGGYDYIKSYIMNNSNFATQYNMSMTYVVSAVLAGTCSAFISVPADIIRKRSMDPISKAKVSEGVLSHITRQIKEEGTYAFRQKLMVNMIRKTLWLSGFFLTYEQVRHYVNINYSNAKIMYH